MQELRTENEELFKENSEFKKLNEQLVYRIEQLQEIIEKTADASNYVYPPKPQELPTLVSKFTEKKSPKKEAAKGETELQKLRRQLMSKMKFKEEELRREMSELKLDYATEVEALTKMVSQSSKEALALASDLRHSELELSKYKAWSQSQINFLTDQINKQVSELNYFKKNTKSIDIIKRECEKKVNELDQAKQELEASYSQLMHDNHVLNNKVANFEKMTLNMDVKLLHEELEKALSRV